MFPTIYIYAATLAIIVQGSLCGAAGIFNFVSSPTGGVPNPDAVVLAVMELSGSSPHDYTDIVSLTFTPRAEKLLGYTGIYDGTFDVARGLNSVTENSDNTLGSTSLPNAGNIGALFVDNYPPIIVDNPPQFVVSKPVRLSLSFFGSSGESFGYISNGEKKLVALGQWIRAVPEPSALALLFLGILPACKPRRKSR